MADQKKITLRPFHASPKTIVVNALPVATPSSGTTIHLYEFHATAKTVVLRDPTATPVVSSTGAVFSGTAAMVFGQSGSLFAPSEFAGSTSLTLGQTGDLDAPTSMSGTATTTFSQTGDLSAPSVLAGSAPLTFDQQGTFNAAAGGAGANFAGTAAMSFGAEATFSAAVAETQEANFNSAYVARMLRRKKQGVTPEPQIVLEANDDDEAIALVIEQFLRVAA